MLVSMLVIALAAAVIGGATMAWFTDEATVDPVTFTAGTLQIDLDNFAENTTESVDLDILNPGDEWEYKFDVTNVGTKSFNWGIYACWKDIVGQDNTALPAGQRELLIARGYGDAELSKIIDWEVYADYGEGEEPIVAGKMPAEGPAGKIMEALAAGSDTVNFRVVASLPEDAGNEYQGSTMEIAFGVQAWQTTNNAPPYEIDGNTCNWLWNAAESVTE